MERSGAIGIAFISALWLLMTACNKDEVFRSDDVNPPVIEFDNESGVYTVKVGEQVTITPHVENASGAVFTWELDGAVYAHGLSFSGVWYEEGEHYLTFVAETPGGTAEADIRVDVLDLTPPVISMDVSPGGLILAVGQIYKFTPSVQHDDMPGFRMEWSVNGEPVGDSADYQFKALEPGTYSIGLTASNCDGSTTVTVTVEVVESLPYSVGFISPFYRDTTGERYTFPGRMICIEPVIKYFSQPEYEWCVDGSPAGDTDMLMFIPDTPGCYRVTLTVSETVGETRHSASASVDVVCVASSPAAVKRVAAPGSSPRENAVYEWLPAPGQFIGDPSGQGDTMESAAAWALGWLAADNAVSLGAFGGYITVGFDHSIPADGGFDFAVAGNAFDTANEPGIVWVMQDVNGNGLPDDEWYQLRGSAYSDPTTRHRYAVTYYRVPGSGQPVPWEASDGRIGQVDYLQQFHDQGSYYPAWVGTDSYTLYGTLLDSRNDIDPATGFWSNRPYAWGYADNCGEDAVTLPGDNRRQLTGFSIANAVYPDGTPADLEFIDFVRVQTGVLANSGWLGEVSTEVLGFYDLSLVK